MGDLASIDKTLEAIKVNIGHDDKYFDRFSHEIRIAQRLVEAKPETKSAWGPLVDKALEYVESEFRNKADMKSVVENAEKSLAPIGEALKEYTIYCVGHAHIDMNWMWNWPETVSVTNDTFSTVDRLLDEFPDFYFSQSQASTYLAAKEYLPEVYEMIKRRVKEGRWEITANTWVECEENIALGEILCRHLLYTKRFIRDEFGFTLDTVKLDWEPDLFGHPHSLPGILAKAGVNAKTAVIYGKAAEALSNFATENRTDLVVIATHGRSGISRWAWGSIADRLVRSVCAPVLIVRAPGCVPGI